MTSGYLLENGNTKTIGLVVFSGNNVTCPSREAKNCSESGTAEIRI